MSEPHPKPDQLAAALRAFAAADEFERDAAELRAQLRRLRATGRGVPSWGRRWDVRPPLPGALHRVAVEAGFLIAAAVFAGVAGFGAAAIVVTMAAAWLVVCVVEWVALRERRSVAVPAEEAGPYEESLVEVLRPSPSARSRSSSARR